MKVQKDIGALFPSFVPSVRLVLEGDESVLECHRSEGGSPTLLRVNALGTSIVQLCDGTRSLHQVIAHAISHWANDGYDVIGTTCSFIGTLNQSTLLQFSDQPEVHPIKVVGSKAHGNPINFALELTDHCNLHCRHCYRSSGPGKSRYMPTGKVLDLLGRLHANGVSTVHLSGGEPLSHPDFAAIFETAVKSVSSVIVLTNGILMDEAIVALFRRHSDSVIIQIDLDGCRPETHDRLRGVPGAFERVKVVAMMLRDRQVPFSMAMNVYPDNLDEMADTAALAHQLGAIRFVCSPVMELGRAKADQALNLEQSQRFIANLEHLYEVEPDFITKPSTSLAQVKGRRNCGAGARSLVIGPSGLVRSCVLMGERQGTFGNIFDEDYEILMRRLPLEFHDALTAPNEAICGDCGYLGFCLGCFARPLLFHKKVTASSHGFVCRWAEVTGYLRFMQQTKEADAIRPLVRQQRGNSK